VTRVVVCAAIELEARGLARRLGLAPVSGSAWPSFRAGVLEVVAVGLGASQLSTRVAGRPSLVVSAGTCGALAPHLAEGDVVVPSTVRERAGTPRDTTPLGARAASGVLLSVAEPVTTAALKARLWLETGAVAVDMESATILAWAAERGLPAAVVRGVADTAAAGIPEDLASVVSPDGAIRTARALRVALARPRALPEALALRHATNAALDGVAAVLAAVARRP
jgi:adenosylhomocysteine nucleosidase